ncbi:MAG: ATP synthase F1 subunit delta [Actinomycetota bacterium]
MAAETSVVKGYAQALFVVAAAEGELDRVEDELYRFGKAVEGQPKLREALTDPSLPAERKKAVIAEILEGKASRHTIAILGFLVEQRRAKDLPKIIEALAEVAAEQRRKAVAEVVSAVPLDEQRRATLAQALSKATGKDLELRVLVDPSLVGGIVARVGDLVFDGSVKRKLELAREQLARVR